ncbi:hypothetical protein JGG62_24100 [Salmonella enterica subsp. enterica serovar Typhimurium]|nr:hypothetical protein [Salmonella enterica subsp. enterica serovar Typhimurium]
MDRASGTGASRRTSARLERRIRRYVVAAPESTTVTILQNVQDVVDAPISARTISRRLGESGFQSCCPLRRLPLTQSHRSQRLQWCRDRASWTTEWHRLCSATSLASVSAVIVAE